jgi:hypothetical protein
MKAPFPWFGGKRKVAPIVWQALGDVANYAEPFAGSLAVLLERPSEHTGYLETVNDADQYIANFWRALAADPEQVAHYADWPINEADLFSRHLWLVNHGKAAMQKGMAADPDWYDAKIAGWWVWGICAWIGGGWCTGKGPHTYASIGADTDGLGAGVTSQLPRLGNAGQGVHRATLAGALYDYMHELAARLRRVRVVCGDWSRIVTNGALSHGSTVGVFLDPPYSDAAERDSRVYNVDSLSVAHDVREWCIANGDNPRYRIVLAGYENEHAAHMPDGWRMVAWKANGGYSNSTSRGNVNRHKERLWFSPHCLGNESAVGGGLFDGGGA